MNYDEENDRQAYNQEKIRKRNIGPDLEKKLNKIYPPNSHIDEKFKNFDLNIYNKSFLKFAAKDGFISLKEIQLEGKKRMNITDFLRGWRGN